MRKKDGELYRTAKGWRNYLRTVRRRKRLRRRESGHNRFLALANKREKTERNARLRPGRNNFSYSKKLSVRPILPQTVRYLLKFPNVFGKNRYSILTDNHLYIPETFSFIDNYRASFEFLKRLLNILHSEKAAQIILDYQKCKRIDVDASICMDIILADFIKHYEESTKRGYRVRTHKITPINYEAEDIKKVLFSIGAFKTIKGISINFPDIEALPVLIGSMNDPNREVKCEIHATQIVEYIKRCLKRLDLQLTSGTLDSLYKVLGETITNAEEHGTLNFRYAIGFFQDLTDSGEHFGIFNFSIINFGETIYQKFTDPKCPNQNVVNRMKQLSSEYTNTGMFSPAEFQEETLWTLYALQQGVTSMQRRRGSGCIQYIDNFFKLKGDSNKDEISQMLLVSGNTRIVFDGTYPIIQNNEGTRKLKMITFNDSGKISDGPNKKYVTFADHYFPGVLISARILIKSGNTKNQENGQQTI